LQSFDRLEHRSMKKITKLIALEGRIQRLVGLS